MPVLSGEEEAGLPLQRAASACRWGGRIQPRCKGEGKPPGPGQSSQDDYADAAGSLPLQQVVAPSNHPRPMQDQELFVWPWMGILANVPAVQTKWGGSILMPQLAEFNPLQFNAVYCSKGYTGYAACPFHQGLDWVIGFKNALAFQNYFKSKRLGKMDWNETNRQGKYIYGWLAKEEDYKSDDPVGRFLSENNDLKMVSDLEHDLSCKTDNLIANLTNHIATKSKYLLELELQADNNPSQTLFCQGNM